MELTGSYKALMSWNLHPHTSMASFSTTPCPSLFQPHNLLEVPRICRCSYLRPLAQATPLPGSLTPQTSHMAHFLTFLSLDSNVIVSASPSLALLSEMAMPQTLPFLPASFYTLAHVTSYRDMRAPYLSYLMPTVGRTVSPRGYVQVLNLRTCECALVWK